MKQWFILQIARLFEKISRKRRLKHKAKSIIRLANMGRPFERAVFLRIAGDKFVYGLPPSTKKLSVKERDRLLLDGKKAEIDYRETQIRIQNVWTRARKRAKREGKLMPSKKEVLYGIKD